MKTIICDFCGKQDIDMKEYIFPRLFTMEARDIRGTVIAKFGKNLGEADCDVCSDCRVKIAEIIDFMINYNNDKNDRRQQNE